MFERRSENILPRRAFARRLLGAFLITLAIVIGSVLLGTCGFRWFVGCGWDEAFHHTCLILGDHDGEIRADTSAGRLFSGFFVLYARLVFVTLVAILLAPLLHRILHRLHLEIGDRPSE